MLRRLWPFLPALVWAAAVWTIGGLQDTPSGIGVPGLDKVAHFGMYGVLGWLLGRGWAATSERRLPVLVPLLLALGLGAADEVRQRSVTGRSAEAADWFADAAGATAGLYFALWMARRQRHDERA